ncbi:cytochrome P450 [Thozetella sp. PMI_491]|nr:cytochrome P450 [Thozetella sp. PMI_491]
MFGQNMSILATLAWAISALAVCFVAQCIYDLFCHPLRRFPGPKIAAIGSYYEFYYDVIKDGTYLWEIEKMHREYGPIVRINSKSLHIYDVHFYQNVYASGNRRINKEPASIAGYTFPSATMTTIGHDLHRRRRAVISPYFSTRAIASLEPFIHQKLDVLHSRLLDTMNRGVATDLTSAFSAFTADVVIHHFYGSHPNYLGRTDLRYGLKDALTALVAFYHLSRFLPFPPNILKRLPLSVLHFVNPSLPLVVSAREDNKDMILKFINNPAEEKFDRNSVILSALTDPTVPAEEKRLSRLLDEGETIIFAGVDTTARSLSVAMFHLIQNKEMLENLRLELQSARNENGHMWTLAELEALPLMRAVVQEAIRLSYGPVILLPRIAVDEAIQYNDYTIPPGTPVSQSTYLMHNDPSIFPDPHIFDPGRWIRAAQDGVNLDKYIVSFSKGSRGCLGINLAHSMLYLGVARIVSGLEMKLFETKQEDIEVYHTRGFGFPKEGSGDVRVKVIGTRI